MPTNHIIKKKWEFLLQIHYSACEDACFNPWPHSDQWVKDPVSPQAAAWVKDGAQIQCCCGCG